MPLTLEHDRASETSQGRNGGELLAYKLGFIKSRVSQCDGTGRPFWILSSLARGNNGRTGFAHPVQVDGRDGVGPVLHDGVSYLLSGRPMVA